jgi:hypothetical protein
LSFSACRTWLHVLEGDQQLEVSVQPPSVVIVLGLIGETFLRFSSTGVEVNVASPTASSAKVVPASDVVPPGRVVWRRVSGGHVFAWHENRLRPLPVVSDPAQAPRQVATWSISMLVDGRHTVLAGTEWYANGAIGVAIDRCGYGADRWCWPRAVHIRLRGVSGPRAWYGRPDWPPN